MPPLPASERRVALPPVRRGDLATSGSKALPGALARAQGRARMPACRRGHVVRELLVTLLPAIVFVVLMGLIVARADQARRGRSTRRRCQQMGRSQRTERAERRGAVRAGTGPARRRRARRSHRPAEPPAEPKRRSRRAAATAPTAAPAAAASRRLPRAAPAAAAGARLERLPAPDGVLDRARQSASRCSPCSTRSSPWRGSRSSRCCWRRSFRSRC